MKHFSITPWKTVYKTAELSGAALDWAVAKCEGDNSVAACYYEDNVPLWLDEADHQMWEPSTNWAQGGPIIEREGISICAMEDGRWTASTGELWMPPDDCGIAADTALIAAMRAYVMAKIGYGMEVPEELLSCAHD